MSKRAAVPITPPTDERENARRSFIWAAFPVAAFTFVLTLYASVKQDDAGGTFFHWGGSFPQWFASSVLAAALSLVFVLALGQRHGDDITRAVATVVAVLLLIGYLTHVSDQASWTPFAALLGGMVALTACRELAERLHNGPKLRLPGRTPLASLVVLWAAVVGLAVTEFAWVDRINPIVQRVQLTEVFRYLLFAVAAAALLTHPKDAWPVARDRTFVLSFWAAAAPLGLLFVTGDIGSAIVLAAGTIAILLARSAPFTALANAAVVALACSLYSVLRADRVETLRREAGIAPTPGTESGWQEESWHVAERYGNWLGFLVDIGVAALAGLLLWTVVKPRATRVGTVAAGLAAMLVTALALPGIARLAGYSFGVSMPLLSTDPTSFVLAFASIGVVLGVASPPGAAPEPVPAVPPATTVAAPPTPDAPTPFPIAGVLAGATCLIVAAVSVAPLFMSSNHASGNLADTVGRVVAPGNNPGPSAPPTDMTTIDRDIQQSTEDAFGDLPGAIVVIDVTASQSLGGGAVLAMHSASEEWDLSDAHAAPGITDLLVAANSKTDTINNAESVFKAGCTPPVVDRILAGDTGCAPAVQALADALPKVEEEAAAEDGAGGLTDGDKCLLHSPEGNQSTIGEVSILDFCDQLASTPAGPGPLSLNPLSAVTVAGIVATKKINPEDVNLLIPCPNTTKFTQCSAAYFSRLRNYPTGQIYQGMKNRGGKLADGSEESVVHVGLAVLEETEATWVIGFSEADNIAFAMMLDPDVTATQVDKVVVALAEIERG